MLPSVDGSCTNLKIGVHVRLRCSGPNAPACTAPPCTHAWTLPSGISRFSLLRPPVTVSHGHTTPLSCAPPVDAHQAPGSIQDMATGQRKRVHSQSRVCSMQSTQHNTVADAEHRAFSHKCANIQYKEAVAGPSYLCVCVSRALRERRLRVPCCPQGSAEGQLVGALESNMCR